MSPISTHMGDEGPETRVGSGSTLGSYKVEALIGEGAMGRVFRARHMKLDRTVALKILHGKHAARPEIIKRFFREARAINKVNHENIVEVTDFVEEEGLAYCVMEYLQGQSLESALKKDGSFTIARTAAVMSQVCEALQAAHEHGVIHRDLKPDNIFLVEKDKEEFVKVLDFGVAKLTEPQAGTQYTVEGTVIGTPAYMSPQQASGFPVDRRADIYSLGVVMYRLLSGRLPFEAPNFAALLAKLTHDPPTPLPKPTPKGETIPPPLAALVMKCLAKSPKDRPQKMSDVARVLNGLMTHGPRPVRKRRYRRAKQRYLVPALGMAAVGGLALFAFTLLRPKEANRVEKEIADRVVSETDKVVHEIPKLPLQLPQQQKISLDVTSKPEGAVVTRLDTGEVLGKTPLKTQLPQKKGTETTLKLSLDGYEIALRKVALGENIGFTVNLKALPKRPVGHTPAPKPKGKHGA